LVKPASVKVVLIIGSGVDGLRARQWDPSTFDNIVAINNAWKIRPDWTHLIHPEDFPRDRMPTAIDTSFQKVITAQQYVPIQNAFGGFLYAGATMAFTAGYWALGALKPDILAFVGCDMVYEQNGPTHFYGSGAADPLRADITLQSLEAKSLRLMNTAASSNCVCVNLSSTSKSRLVFPKLGVIALARLKPQDQLNLLRTTLSGFDERRVSEATNQELALNYMAASGKYWEDAQHFDARALFELDQLWLASFSAEQQRLVA
jgi:hypothetical protein